MHQHGRQEAGDVTDTPLASGLYPWSEAALHLNIATKELFPIVMATAVWGHRWQNCIITSRSDNAAVVAVLNFRTCRDRQLMHLLRCLFFYEAYWQFKIWGRHIAVTGLMTYHGITIVPFSL